MTTTVAAIALTILALAALAPLVARYWRRRLDHGEHRVTQRRIAELQALPAPDELERAPDLTKAQRRHLRGRGHPIARKRDGDPRY